MAALGGLASETCPHSGEKRATATLPHRPTARNEEHNSFAVKCCPQSVVCSDKLLYGVKISFNKRRLRRVL
ncbi:hypothetical protein JTE90_014824 [Oedothorax gibbosus]|uniref:Uncharacterized protein n=1 Tax=Oedothorax gibbosus TaxID=931172 RepID=A0AAV6UD93_9ARAC|nr:hypothetical protein JTE90_014824 [Oedothorax gibbosus]